MSDQIYNVLFLCNGNSARSLMAEAILRRDGGGRFRAFSAGAHPSPDGPNASAMQLLARNDHPTGFARSKSWEEFDKPDAPRMDFVITVCDKAAAEPCPVWPGQPMTAHWGVPDPVLAGGNAAETAVAFANAYQMLRNRISIFVSLPIESLDTLALQAQLDKIGRTADHSQIG